MHCIDIWLQRIKVTLYNMNIHAEVQGYINLIYYSPIKGDHRLLLY